MSADDIYLSTTSDHLSGEDEGNTDINERAPRRSLPNLHPTQRQGGSPPRALTFTAAIDRHAVAATSIPHNKDPQIIEVRT